MSNISNNKKPLSNLGRAASPPRTVENNYTTEFPLVTMGCPKFTPKTAPSYSTISTTHIIHQFLDLPYSHPKQHPDAISRFPQYTTHRTDRQANRQTDRQTDGQMGNGKCMVKDRTRNPAKARGGRPYSPINLILTLSHRGATPKFLGGPNLRPTTDVIQAT